MIAMAQVPEPVARLERRLREIFGDRLQSFAVYGSNASTSRPATTSHEGHTTPAPVQTLAILGSLTRDDLHRCAAHIAEWHEAGLATPLLLTASEFRRSLDSFPLEFAAILANHIVVSGTNPFEGLHVDPGDIRRACEVQARSHLLHLREGFIETQGRPDALAVLIVRSAAPFAALLASLARLQGLPSGDDTTAGRQVERNLHVTPGVITDVVELAHVTEISSAEAVRIFPAYLDAAERLVAYVDGWAVRSTHA
jgi:hypothetical protein